MIWAISRRAISPLSGFELVVFISCEHVDSIEKWLDSDHGHAFGHMHETLSSSRLYSVILGLVKTNLLYQFPTAGVTTVLSIIKLAEHMA